MKTPFQFPNRERELPTRAQAAAFFAKAWIFRLQRTLIDPNGRPHALKKKSVNPSASVLAESRSPLYGNALPAEFALQAGKVANLRLVAAHLDGLVMPAGEVFSFWANVPRPTRRRGFVEGRELREGCVIPSIGGGLCQLSNALYDVALNAGFEIVERHAHSRKLPGSMAAEGRDATIFWNYVDLRWRVDVDSQLEVSLDRNELLVRIRGVASSPVSSSRTSFQGVQTLRAASEVAAESCETCGTTSCFRHTQIPELPKEAVTAWLVDAWWPEHDAYLHANRGEGDWLFTPLDSKRFGIGPYRWSSDGFAKVRQAPWFVAERSWRSRKLAAQGAARQRALLAMDEKLARRYMRSLPYTATHLVVSQNLLPFLWNEGALGGRTYDVLMTRLPMSELQTVLDRAAKRWPDSPTLADFRAPAEVVEAETAALSEARQWITPHSAIARLAGTRAVKLAWKIPESAEKPRQPVGNKILFPAGTLGRKGAWEVREVARALDLEVVLGGPVLEGKDFWNGVPTTVFNNAIGEWPRDVRAVVLPAWVENQPRRLLKAIAAGVPVIASENCGLGGVPGVTEVPIGDVEALQACLAAMLARTS